MPGMMLGGCASTPGSSARGPITIAQQGSFIVGGKKVVAPGKMAAWIAPPERGINNMAVDYEYVHLN